MNYNVVITLSVRRGESYTDHINLRGSLLLAPEEGKQLSITLPDTYAGCSFITYGSVYECLDGFIEVATEDIEADEIDPKMGIGEIFSMIISVFESRGFRKCSPEGIYNEPVTSTHSDTD